MKITATILAMTMCVTLGGAHAMSVVDWDGGTTCGTIDKRAHLLDATDRDIWVKFMHLSCQGLPKSIPLLCFHGGKSARPEMTPAERKQDTIEKKLCDPKGK